MGKSDIARMYKYMSAEDQRTFDRWLKANAHRRPTYSTV